MDATAVPGRDDLLPHAQQGATLEPGVKFALVPVPSGDMGQQARGGPLALRTPTKQPRGQQDARWAPLTYFGDAFRRSRCQEGQGRLASPSTPSLAFFLLFFFSSRKPCKHAHLTILFPYKCSLLLGVFPRLVYYASTKQFASCSWGPIFKTKKVLCHS